MTYKKTVNIVRNFLSKIQAWVDESPAIVNVSMEIGDRTIILAEKKKGSPHVEKKNKPR